MVVVAAAGAYLWLHSSGNFERDTRQLLDKLEKVDMAVTSGVKRADYAAVAEPLKEASENYVMQYGSTNGGEPVPQAVKIAVTSYLTELKFWQQHNEIAGN